MSRQKVGRESVSRKLGHGISLKGQQTVKPPDQHDVINNDDVALLAPEKSNIIELC